ncbi:MAG: hypothetical protein A2Z99_06970, partial [Treponema sp. GWB1_62_6]
MLVVDDVPDSIGILSETLSDEYTVLAAIDGETALRIALSPAPPDLILMDIMMPGMNGFAVCEALKRHERSRKIPIIFLTASDDIDMKTRGFAMGAVDYITKPFTSEEVVARIGTHIALVRARNKLEAQNRELVEAAKLKEDVELIMRHDLKSPLNAIIGLPQIMLLQENLSSAQRDNLGMILDAGKKMLGMINLSLDLFKMERGIYPVSPVEVDILKVLGEARLEFIRPARTSAIELELSVDGRTCTRTDERIVMAEELLCYSLISNL